MLSNAYDAYLENKILSASPVELIRILYQGALSSIRDAKGYLAEGDIAKRSRAISKATAILTELSCSLNHEAAADLGARLASLYDYMQRRLLEANFEQSEAPLNEVLALLATLAESWEEIDMKNRSETAGAAALVASAPNAWAQNFLPEAVQRHTPQNWSF